MTERVFQLAGSCNNYPWGKKGGQSLAAQLCKGTVKDFEIKDDEYYSELWFGDYPDYPAKVLGTGELLKDVLDKNKQTLLGKRVIEQLDGQLPYLPKAGTLNLCPNPAPSLATYAPTNSSPEDSLHRQSTPPSNPPQQTTSRKASRQRAREVYGSQPQARNRHCPIAL